MFNDDTERIAAKTQYGAALKTDILMQKLKSASFTEIDNWVDYNVTSLATARVLFKKMLMVMSYLLNK